MGSAVKHPTLGFRSGHDLTVHEFDPQVGLYADTVEPVSDSVSPSLSAPFPLAVYLSLKNKQTSKIEYTDLTINVMGLKHP